MSAEKIYIEFSEKVLSLYKSALKEMEDKFNDEKLKYTEKPGILKQILEDTSSRKKFLETYSPGNYVLTDSKGKIKYVNPKLDTNVFKLYLDLYKKPEELVSQLYQ